MLIAITCFAAFICTMTTEHTAVLQDFDGHWNAHLDSPGGSLRFGLEISTKTVTPTAWIVNGEERIQIPRVSIEGDTLELEFVHYDSVIRATAVDFTSNPHDIVRRDARIAADEQTIAISGHWSKRSGADAQTTMPFMAWRIMETNHEDSTAPPSDTVASGRWAVDFSSSDDPAVGIFEVDRNGIATGTFLTTLGDYRYLGGTYRGGELELSCFDGAHAFLFKASMQEDGSLAGDFWSRDSWHETWTAVRDDDAALPDAWQLTTWTDDAKLDQLNFRDLDGNLVSPADDRFAGKARIIEVFGTWCPNCYDATRYLIELNDEYGERGLSVLGLAFEITGDDDRDRAQVKTYIDHHGIDYPVLLAGISDKAEATRSFPVLDRVRSYPTFIFIDSDNKVRGIYTGFSGPATGAANERLRESFEQLIEQMLDE